jgi:two-component system, response regulator / RNA-binding antiterminator
MPRILIAYEPPVAPEPVRFALLGSGYSVVDEINDPAKLAERAQSIAPAITIVACISPKPPLHAAFEATRRLYPHPMLVYAAKHDSSAIDLAFRAGVASYIVDGFSAKRIRSDIDIAIAHFRVVREMHQQVADAQDKLAERKAVERAKGILMQARSMKEDEAYQALRKLAMDQSKPLREVAENVINMSKLLVA